MEKHFTTKELVRYSAPTIAMSFFVSLYGIVDGIFVANFAGTSAFAAVNIIMPYIMILSVTGFMIGTGGSALVSKIRGEGNAKRANEVFSLLVYFAFLLGLVLAVIGWLCARPVAVLLGAEGPLIDICVSYGQILMLSLPFYTLQYAFQAFFPAAGKPNLGFGVVCVAGVANMLLDALFIASWGLGVEGAAYATVISEILGGGIPIVYFACKNSSFFKLGKCSIDFRAVGKACANGSSEMVTIISSSLIAMLYNFQLLRYIGEIGVAAFGVVYYASLLFFPVFSGFIIATSPILSFQFGAQNRPEMRSIVSKSLKYMIVVGFSMLICTELLAVPLSALFSAGNGELNELTIWVFRVGAFAFLPIGLVMYGSAFFTAVNNGLVSAILSLLSTFVFEGGAVLVFPEFLGIEGIWFSWPVAVFLGAIIAVIVIKTYGRRYLDDH